MPSVLLKFLLLICLPVIGSLNPNLVGVWAADHAMFSDEMLRIEFLTMEKHHDGQVSQTFAVYPPERAATTVSILFQENKKSMVYKAVIKNNTFTIFVNKPSRIRLFAIVKARETTHVLHTNIVLFGNSRIPVQRIPAASEGRILKTIPHISLISADTYYWHQTGIPLTFTLGTNFQPALFNSALPALNVIENSHIKPVTADKEHPFHFIYTPPLDEKLRQSGYTAFRQDTLFTEISHWKNRYHLTYALKLHRSRHAYDNHGAGAAVLGSGIFIFTGMILYKRRTRQWWNE